MQFTKTTPNENFPQYRWTSENAIWEIGFYPVLFGLRLRLGKVGYGWVNLDYCAGDDPTFALVLLAVVVKILDALPESVTGSQVERLFPDFEVKPIDRDPYCWARLQELAVLLPEEITRMITDSDTQCHP